MRDFALNVWRSPTLMTWASFLTRSLGLLVVLPLALRQLDAAEIVVWYLLNAIFGLQWMIDLGFTSTTSRAISYASAGVAAGDHAPPSPEAGAAAEPNWELIARIRSTAAWVYAALAAVSLLLLGVFGTWSLLQPIANVPNASAAWSAWLIVLFVCPVSVFANQYWAQLEGMNHVALVRRWETLVGIASSLTMIAALQLGGGLLAVVASYQAWILVRIAVFWQLARKATRPGRGSSRAGPDRGILRDLWSSAWRSGVGGGAAYGLAYAASILVAHTEDTAAAASYLISARLLEAVLQFSQAPFYSKLPAFTRLRATRSIDELVDRARRAMRLGYWCFIAGFLVLAVFAQPALRIIGSNTAFVPPGLWCLMGLAIFAQLYGSMHIQLYTTTNHVIWHVANTGAGVVFALVTATLVREIGVYAVPLGALCGYAGFYAWYSARHSYRSLATGFWRYEARVALPPALVLLAYAGFAVVAMSWTVD